MKFLIEVCLLDKWVPYKILTRSPSIHDALNRLPDLVKDIKGEARIKRLSQDVQIAEAKIEITRLWGIKHVET
jgi:hypothetical protein